MKRCVLVGIAGDVRSYSLSLYNLKSYAMARQEISKEWKIDVVQSQFTENINDHHRLTGDIMVRKPDLVGISTYLWNIRAFEGIARSIQPHTKIAWGGPEMSRDWVIDGRYDRLSADYIISGEGEATFADLLQGMRLEKINGLSYRHGERFLVNSPRTPFRSLSEVPSPYLSACVEDNLFERDLQANIETQRGCSLRCSYCIYHKDMDTISYSTVERTLAESEWCLNRGARSIRLVDANFGSDLEHAKSVMRGLITINARCDLMFELIPGFIDEELSELFSQFAGLHPKNRVELGIGVQTVNLDVLRIMRRGIRAEKFVHTLKLLQRPGISAKIDLIVGLPTETEESWNRTLEYMCHVLKGALDYFLCVHVLRGLPGTELLTISKKYGQVFISRDIPHELYESPAMPREAMVRSLRRSAIAYRIMNARRWNRVSSITDKFHQIKQETGLGYVELIDCVVTQLMDQLDQTSRFKDPDFPNAEYWWFYRVIEEVPDSNLLKIFSDLTRGFTPARTNTARLWNGIGLLASGDR